MLRKLMICLATVVLTVISTVGPTTASPELLALDVTLADLGYEEDDTVHGVQVTRDYTVRWPEA